MLGVGRYHAGEKLLAYFNFDYCERVVWTGEDAPLLDLWTGRTQEDGALPIPSGGFLWLTRTYDKEAET